MLLNIQTREGGEGGGGRRRKRSKAEAEVQQGEGEEEIIRRSSAGTQDSQQHPCQRWRRRDH